jgi:uncharacterized membrane protein
LLKADTIHGLLCLMLDVLLFLANSIFVYVTRCLEAEVLIMLCELRLSLTVSTADGISVLIAGYRLVALVFS